MHKLLMIEAFLKYSSSSFRLIRFWNFI